MKNACRPDWQTEFADQIDDLLHTPAVQNLQYYPHHHRVTRYEHVLLVAQLSFRIARAWGLDSRAVARSALLHDLYHGGKDANYLRHSRTHPLTALHNVVREGAEHHRQPYVASLHSTAPKSGGVAGECSGHLDRLCGCTGLQRKAAQTGWIRSDERAGAGTVKA